MANSVIGKSMFTGVCLLTPYYRFNNEKLYNYMPFFKLCNYIKPHYRIVSEFTPLDPDYMAKWGHLHRDPRSEHFFTPKTATIWDSEQVKAKTAIMHTNMPLLFIEADGDTVVRNDYIQEYAALASKQAESER